MATVPLNAIERAREREERLLSHLEALARAGSALPNERGLAEAVGVKGHGSGHDVLRRLADNGLVVIEGRYHQKVVHIPGSGLSLASACNPEGKRRRPVAEIVELVAAAACLTPEDVTGPRRTNLYLRPRFLVVMLARDELWSFGEIGRAIGRDHSSVIHAWGRAHEMLATDRLFARLHRRALDELRGRAALTFQLPPRAPTHAAVSVVTRHPIEVDENDASQKLDLYRRRRGADQLLSAIQRAYPERCAA